MKNKYFVGEDHHKFHLRWYKTLLGGEFFEFPCNTWDQKFDGVLEADGEDVVWFFSDLYPKLHPLLKGKQIHVGHGWGCFKRSLNQDRLRALSECFDQVWAVSQLAAKRYREGGVPDKNIVPIGQPILLKFVERGWDSNALLVSFGCFGDWGEFDILLDSLRRRDSRIRYFVTTHPSLSEEKARLIQNVVSNTGSFTIVNTQDELLHAMKVCGAIIVSSSSVAGPFWFSGRPVILARGKLGRNPFRGWSEIKERISDDLFSRVVNESTLVGPFQPFTYRRFATAKVSQSAKSLFFPWNYSEDELVRRVRAAYEMLV